MALRQRIYQENVSLKSVPIKSVRDIQKRKALREVGNKMPNLEKNKPVKKNGALSERKSIRSVNVEPLAHTEYPPKKLRPPQAGYKKTNTALPIEETMKTLKLAVDPVPHPQKSIMNPIHDENKAPRRGCMKSYSRRQLDIIDPDENSKNDPVMVCEYVEDIFAYLRIMENKFPIRKNFLEGHETSPWMRKILIDWIVEVHMNFKMLLETLHLCVAIIDRYLQENNNVGRGDLQLVGISSLLVAAKYEEISIPPLSDFMYVCFNTYSKKQILAMEMRIVKQLDYSFGRPLSVHFLRRYSKVAQVRSNHHSLGKFLLELALLECQVSHVNPSLQAAAACCLSVGIIEEFMDLSSVWTPTLVHYTKYEYSEIESTIVSLANILVTDEAPKFQAVRQKYSCSSQGKISLNPKLNGPLVRKLTANE